MKQRIVITGIGIITSIGEGHTAFWKNVLAGMSGISKIEGFDTANQFTHYGGEIKKFAPGKYISSRHQKLFGRTSQLAIAAVGLLLKDAHVDVQGLRKMNVGLCVGTTGGESQDIESIDRDIIQKGEEAVKTEVIRRYPVNNLVSNIAKYFKINSFNRVFTTACAAGNYSVGYGYDLLQLGKVDAVIAGGADAFSWLSFSGFNQLGAVAPEKCQPFDKNRKGMIPGEGAGFVLLEPLEQAIRRGVTIYAEVLGYGLSCDAYHITQPEKNGIVCCLENALKNAAIKFEEVDYICAHGTGTTHNDKTECAAIKQVFKERSRQIFINSLKSMLGHTMGAASAIETISCCLSLKEGVIPPTINFETPDPDCDIDCVPNKMRRKAIKIALNNAFAFGGNNCILVLKKLGD